MELELKKIVPKAIEYAALFAVLGTVGTYWINTEVERRMDELAIDPSAAPAVVTLKADVANIKETHGAALDRVEGKVDAFSREFLKYLERQAQ